MATIMYGKPVAEEILATVRKDVSALRTRGITPRLDVVLVGNSPASQRYVGKKIEKCRELGMHGELHTFDEAVSAQELRDRVQRLSDNADVHAVLVQLPLPGHIEEPGEGFDKFDVFDAVKGEKDVDGISRYTVPELYRAKEDRMLHLPATALAVRRVLDFYGVETEARVAVIVGR